MIIGGRQRSQPARKPEDDYSDLEFMRGFLEVVGGQQISQGDVQGLSQQAANQKGGMASPALPGRGTLGVYGQGPAKASPLSERGMGPPVQPGGGRVSPEVMTPSHGKDFWRYAQRYAPVVGGVLGGPLGAAVGAAIGGIGGQQAGPQAGATATPAQYAPPPEMTSAFEQAMLGGLQGQGMAPPSLYETQYGMARAGLAAQTARAREQMMGQMAGMGMARSGVMAEGLQGLQQAQLQGQAGIGAQLAAQRVAEQQLAQREAMQRYIQMQGVGVQAQQVGVQAQQVGVQRGYLDLAARAAQEQRQIQFQNELAALIEAWQRERGTPTYSAPQASAFPLTPPGGYAGATGSPTGVWGPGALAGMGTLTPPARRVSLAGFGSR